jgi:hypothetical protein
MEVSKVLAEKLPYLSLQHQPPAPLSLGISDSSASSIISSSADASSDYQVFLEPLPSTSSTSSSSAIDRAQSLDAILHDRLERVRSSVKLDEFKAVDCLGIRQQYIVACLLSLGKIDYELSSSEARSNVCMYNHLINRGFIKFNNLYTLLFISSYR